MEPFDDWSYSYLLGLYLGDGWVGPHERTARLVITLDGAYPEIIDDAVASVQLAGPWQRVSLLYPKDSRAVVVSSYSKHWLDVFPQYGPGRKHNRPIVLADWQREVVDRHPRQFLRGRLGVRWTQSNHRNISVSHRRSVAILDEFIGPKR